MRRLCALAVAAALTSGGAAWAGHHETGEKAGGKAMDHMSDQAKEKSNAQWMEGSERARGKADDKAAEVDAMKKATGDAEKTKGKAKGK